MERRSSPRFRLDLSCRLYRGDCETHGQLLDVADGGLAVMTASAATQGDAFRVVITRPGAPRIEVDALAWHSRHVRLASGDSSYLIGLVLSAPSPAYEALLRECAAELEEADAAEVLDSVRLFRIRMGLGPRTRISITFPSLSFVSDRRK